MRRDAAVGRRAPPPSATPPAPLRGATARRRSTFFASSFFAKKGRWWGLLVLIPILILILVVALAALVARSPTPQQQQQQQPPPDLRDKPPIFSVGVVSDLQHANRSDGRTMGVRRYYANSLEILDRARAHWLAESGGGDDDARPLSSVLVLGDVVDRSAADPEACVNRVLAKLAGLPDVRFALGNHDVETVAPRRALLSLLGIDAAAEAGGEDLAYHAFRPVPGFKLVVLDAYAVSAYWPPDHPGFAEAAATLARARGGAPLSADPRTLKSPKGLRGFDRRFTSLGGALGARQLAWLRGELRDSSSRGERVVVFSHVPCHPRVCSRRCGHLCLSWDYGEILGALRDFDCVAAFFAGHDHPGGMFSEQVFRRESGGGGGALRTPGTDKRWVHHVTLPGVIETPPGDTSFGTLDFHREGIFLRGHGRLESRWLPF